MKLWNTNLYFLDLHKEWISQGGIDGIRCELGGKTEIEYDQSEDCHRIDEILVLNGDDIRKLEVSMVKVVQDHRRGKIEVA